MDTTSHRDIADLKGVLRAHGLRATIPRVAVLQALDAVPGHLSAERLSHAPPPTRYATHTQDRG